MNTSIGITEWRDLGVSSSYPLEANIVLKDLFVDAVFVQFDSFIPTLIQVAISGEGITFTFQFDDGSFSYLLSAANCKEGTTFRVAKPGRYYGTLVCGPGIERIYTNDSGRTLEANTPFIGGVVRSIPSKAGVYTLQGNYGDVGLVTDEAQRLISTNQNNVTNITWNAVSKPSKAQQFRLSQSKLYGITEAAELVEINPISGSISVLCDYPQAFSSIIVTNGKLLGTYNNNLFDITSVPGTSLCSTATGITALTSTDAEDVYCTSGSTLIKFNKALDAIDATVTLDSLASKGLIAGEQIYSGFIDKLLFTTPGVLNTNNNKTTSDFLKLISTDGTDTEIIGAFTDASDGSVYLPPIQGLAVIDNTLYGLFADSTQNLLCRIDYPSLACTTISSTIVDKQHSKIITLMQGADIIITVKDISALQTINAVEPIDNALQVSSYGLINLRQTAVNELTVELAVDIADTTILKSKQYGD